MVDALVAAEAEQAHGHPCVKPRGGRRRTWVLSHGTGPILLDGAAAPPCFSAALFQRPRVRWTLPLSPFQRGMPAAHRRLRQLGGHVAAVGAAAGEGSAGEGSALKLLDDSAMAHFIEHGYVLLPLDELPAEFHADLYAKCERRWAETDGKNGKEIFKEIPELNRVLMSKTLQGGLTSVLGRDYTMHPARHMHVSGNRDGGFHKDGGHCSIRHHRPRWAMAMYYAGGCTVSMGPTSVIPGSQFLDVIEGKSGGPTPVEVDEEVRVVVPPGTVLLHHYEISHRATGRTEDDAPWRCMFKLQFARCSEPTEPSWRTSGVGTNPFANHTNPALADCWDWLSGKPGATTTSSPLQSVDELVRSLDADTEVERAHAAYSLAVAVRCGSTDALDGLMNALQSVDAGRVSPGPYQAGSASVLPRVAMRGLAASGQSVVAPLISMLRHDSPTVVANAAFALGEAAPPSVQVVRALHDAYGAACDSLALTTRNLDSQGEGDFQLPYGGNVQKAHEAHDMEAVKTIREHSSNDMDPQATAVRRICAVAAQALGIIGARATANAMTTAGSAEDLMAVQQEVGRALASRLAQPEPGAELIRKGIIRDGMGGSTDKDTEVRQQLALAALRLSSHGRCASPVARVLDQAKAPALYDAGEPTVRALTAAAVGRLRWELQKNDADADIGANKDSASNDSVVGRDALDSIEGQSMFELLRKLEEGGAGGEGGLEETLDTDYWIDLTGNA